MVLLTGRLVQIFQSKFKEYIQAASQIFSYFIEFLSSLLSVYESTTDSYLSELIASVFGTIHIFINWLVLFRKWLKENNQLDTNDVLIVNLVNICIVSTHKQVGCVINL